jgi:asparagine synthase (glutamine-hydrolysing)
MCGIAGLVAPDWGGDIQSVTRKMLAVLTRRGPDSEGLESWPGVTLGHRRLAILDLSPAGHQPMLSDDGQTGVVFNGCIYNFLELRGQLEQRGHRFRSQSDTEVLVRGYQEWGVEQLVRRLRGMYAFAIWDERQRRLALVRDRLGVKPLVYAVENGCIAFSSTVAALRVAGMGGEIDPQAVLELLEYGFVTDERCIYAGIQKLPPATILEWQDGKIKQELYWTLPEADESSTIKFEEAVEETERLLVEAVRLRLQADVPIGVLLSGGIDSALVCWAMAKLNANVRAYTVAAPDDPADESAEAARTAKILGISHEVVPLPETRPALLDELVDAYSEPFGSSSALALLQVSRAIKPVATVLLTGDGGDDVFLGYPFLRNAWTAQRIARLLPETAARAWKAAGPWIPAMGPLQRGKSLLNYATSGLGGHVRAHDGLPYFERRAMLGERLAGQVLAQRQIPGSFASGKRLLYDVLAYHRKMHFTSEFMPKVDGATMHYALEARAPFLDQKIWEFAAALPATVRFHGGRLKAVLREIVRRRVAPQVASRRKQGFTVPVERWLAERWSGALDRLRERTMLEQEGWVRPGTLRAAIDEGVDKQWIPIQLWHLLVLEHWLNKREA